MKTSCPNMGFPFPFTNLHFPVGHVCLLSPEAVLCPPLLPTSGKYPSLSPSSFPFFPVLYLLSVSYSLPSIPLGQINLCAEKLVLLCPGPIPIFPGVITETSFSRSVHVLLGESSPVVTNAGLLTPLREQSCLMNPSSYWGY